MWFSKIKKSEVDNDQNQKRPRRDGSVVQGLLVYAQGLGCLSSAPMQRRHTCLPTLAS